MKLDIFGRKKKTNDDELNLYLKNVIFEDELLFHRFNINLKEKYQFIYDDFFEHLLKDTDKYTNQYLFKIKDFRNFKIDAFKKIFNTHIWFESSLSHPLL